MMVNKKCFDERLVELSCLKDGWLDGEGSSISIEALESSKDFIYSLVNENFVYPVAFPEYNGGIILEWFNDSIGISIDIDNSGKTLILSAYSFINKQDFNCNATIDNTYEIKKKLEECLNILRNIH